jgi:outer membrane cobalamin receptor
MCPRLALRALFSFLLLSSTGFASDLKITVLDPRSARVAGAQISVYRPKDDVVVALTTTDSRGETVVRNIANGDYRLEVLAPGFVTGHQSLTLPGESTATVKLGIAVEPWTVVVSATRTPVPADESGSVVETLDHDQIETLQPVAAADALRFVPGAIVADTGSRGGLTSLFVRGGDSRYNKVLVDGVPANESGGTFNFGVVPLQEVDRLELARGPQSTLYGSDAMTSLVQVWSRTGRTLTPELTFGADGGNFGTAHGYGSLAGAWKRFDYNLFADHFSTDGQDVNNSYFNTLEGGNVGVQLSPRAMLRFRTRHFNSRVGTPGAWDFPGKAELPKDTDARARQNDFLGNLELTLNLPSRWQHRFQVYDYNTRRLNIDDQSERGCDPLSFVFTDCFFSDYANQNRLGFQYQGDYQPRSWAHSTFGYEFEDENGFFHTRFPALDPITFSSVIAGGSDLHGLRRNHAVYGQQILIWKRLTAISGARYVHNESFGDRVVPRIALSYVLWDGHGRLPRTRLRGTYAEGIKEPRFEESFGITGTFPENPNPNLKPERSRSFEAGFIQTYAEGKYSLTGTYFNNLFRQQIVFNTFTNPDTNQLENEFFNLGRSIAHGAEVEFHARIRTGLSLDGGYTYTSTQITKALPFCVSGFTDCNFFPEFTTGRPLLRRPRHSGNVLLSYFSKRWGATLGGTFTGRRPDSDFLVLAPLGLTADHTDAYARWDIGAWYAVHHRVTIYADGENIFDRHYQDVLGFKGQLATIRAGVRFRIGGE